MTVRDRRLAPGAVAALAVGVLFVGWPAAASITSLPFPSLYTNSLGAGRIGYFFPHDEFYDLGARESINYIAEHAPNGATVASEAPGVLQYYLERYGRSDLTSEIISHPTFTLARGRDAPGRDARGGGAGDGVERFGPDFVLVQPGRRFYETREVFAEVQAEWTLAQSSMYRGASAASVYVRPVQGSKTGCQTPANEEVDR